MDLILFLKSNFDSLYIKYPEMIKKEGKSVYYIDVVINDIQTCVVKLCMIEEYSYHANTSK